jgi:hypothetical protein
MSIDSATKTLNVNLLRTALDAIESDPEHFDRHGWATRDETGESYSLAARVCLLAGQTINWNRVNEWGNATFLIEGRAIPNAASDLLGLGMLDAYKLFDVELDIPRTRMVAERLIRRAARRKASR